MKLSFIQNSNAPVTYFASTPWKNPLNALFMTVDSKQEMTGRGGLFLVGGGDGNTSPSA